MAIDLDRLRQPFPANALKTREGGGNRRFTYVETHTVIHRLNDACPDGWDWTIDKLDWHGDLLICTGMLHIHGLGVRAGIGVQKMSERGGEDLAKGASSDALKKAATLFGVALELYGPDYEEHTPTQAAQGYDGDTHYSGQDDAPSNGQASATGPMQGAKAITAKQHAMVKAIGSKLGWKGSTVVDQLTQLYGVTSTLDLDKAQVRTYIDYLKRLEFEHDAQAQEAQEAQEWVR